MFQRAMVALGQGGNEAVAEAYDFDEPNQIKGIDVVMLAVTGGLERKEAQYQNLFATAGLRLERVIETKGPISVLEAIPV